MLAANTAHCTEPVVGCFVHRWFMDSLAEHSTIPSAAEISREGGISVSQLNGSTAAGREYRTCPETLVDLLVNDVCVWASVCSQRLLYAEPDHYPKYICGWFVRLTPAFCDIQFGFCPVCTVWTCLQDSWTSAKLSNAGAHLPVRISDKSRISRNAFSHNREITQGLSAGALFLTILPVGLISFPNQVRNWFLF